MSSTLDTKHPALIVKMSRTVIHHGALAVARTLGRQGVPVYAVIEDALVPLATSRYLTRAFVWERCPADAESFVKAMSSIGESIARPTIVFPMDDLSAVFVAENAAKLARWFVVPRVPQQLPLQLASKARLHALCAQIGIPCARSIVPNSFDDVKAFAEGASFPLIVKTAEQWLPVNNMFCAKAIQTREELFHLCRNHNYEGAQRLILQEYIPGDDWICHGYYNFEKNISVTFTGKKLRGYPPDAGSTSLGLSVDNEELRCVSERLLKSVAYSGIIDMDWRRDQRDGQYKLLDCNPRVGQNFRMFENEAGIDVVRAQHLDLSGRRIDQGRPIEGRLFSVEPFRILALLRRLPWGASRQDAAKHFPPKTTELAWWSNDDPMPFLVMILRMFTRTLGRALGFRLYFRFRSQLSRFFSNDAKAPAIPRA
jgi:D-aspartate ligase